MDEVYADNAGAVICHRQASPALKHAHKKPPAITDRGLLCLMPDDDLLSHGETPHYHRRCIVSLLSSGWDQVVPMLYSRQANGLRQCRCCTRIGILVRIARFARGLPTPISSRIR